MSTLIQPEWVKMELCDMGKSIFNDLPLSQDRFDLKKLSIETSLALQDYELLKSLTMTREGLLTVELRRKVWPVLMGIRQINGVHHIDDETGVAIDYRKLPVHPDEDQLKLDVERSFVFYPSDKSDFELGILREKLSNLITKILRFNPDLNYYQGYHDVATVMLLVFKDETQAFNVLEQFTLVHLRDFMLPIIDFSIDHLKLIPNLLSKIDAKFAKIIGSVQPFYSLSSILTLYAHNFKSFEDVCLMWDYIMCENSMCFAIYFYTATLVYFKQDIFDELQQISGCNKKDVLSSDKFLVENKDFVHSILSNLVDKNLNNVLNKSSIFFEILQLTIGYLHKFPPLRLEIYQDGISLNSVLKNSSLYKLDLTLEDVNTRMDFYNWDKLHELFDKQLQETELRKLAKLKEQETPPPLDQSMNKFMFLTKYLSLKKSKNNSINLRNKNLKLHVFQISFALGMLSVLLKYYGGAGNSSDMVGYILTGLKSLRHFINAGGIGISKIGLNDLKETLHRFR